MKYLFIAIIFILSISITTAQTSSKKVQPIKKVPTDKPFSKKEIWLIMQANRKRIHITQQGA